MCIQFRSYLRGARFTLRTDHKSLVWLHRFKDTEGMMSRWLHALQQFQFSIVHRLGKDHGNADGLSRAPSSPCRQCTRPDCPPAVLRHSNTDQPFDSVSTGSSEDADLVPVQSGEDWTRRRSFTTGRNFGGFIPYFGPSARGPGVYYITCMDCRRCVSTMGGGEEHATRTPLIMASS